MVMVVVVVVVVVCVPAPVWHTESCKRLTIKSQTGAGAGPDVSYTNSKESFINFNQFFLKLITSQIRHNESR